MSKTKKVPNLRFQGFTDDWEQRKFMDLIDSIIDFRGRTPKKLGMNWSNEGLLALSAQNVKDGYIDKTIDAHYGSQTLYDKWMNGRELHKGQVVFTTEAPMGNVARIPDENKYILSQRTIAFTVKNTVLTEGFLMYLLESPSVKNNLLRISSGGTAKGVSQKTLSSLTVKIPTSLKEQERINFVFYSLDSLITLHQHKLDQLRVLKEILLQKLFANDQHDKPELRFKDFTDKWEKVKIGSLFTESTEKSATGQLLSVSINKGVYPFDETERKNNSSKNKSNYKFVEKYDIAYNSMRMWQGAEGVSYYSGIVSPAYTVLKPQQNSNPEFYAYMFKRAEMLNKFRRYSQGLTSDTWNLKFPILKTISLRTTDIKEQEKIVQLLRMVKDNISLQQKKLTQYQQAKKFLLQQMFI